MKNKWRILKILVTIIIFGLLLSFSLKRFNNTKLNDIEINLVQKQGSEKVYFIDEKNVKSFVLKQNTQGKIGTIDIPALEKEINAFPSVDSANVYLNLNGKLNIDILQRVPVFRLTKNGKTFYIDENSEAFPISKNYSHDVMLVSGNVPVEDYKNLVTLVKKINADAFAQKYFIGIIKDGINYQLITSDGNFKVEIGSLENIDFKLKGFKTLVEKFLVHQDTDKYSKISLKFNNQIVTTLNLNYKGNDSLISARKKDIANSPIMVRQNAVSSLSSDKVKKTEEKTENKKEKK